MIDRDIRDTVSSIAGGRKSMLPGTIDWMKHVSYFRHALALDERRVKFLPEYAYEGTAKPLEPIDKTIGTWAVIQLVRCADLELLQSPRECFHKRRRFGLQGRTQICRFIHIHK